MRIQYGEIDYTGEWKMPSMEIFANWMQDFFNLPYTRKFKVHLVGRFIDHLYGEINDTRDIDIVLTENFHLEEIAYTIQEGTRIGIEKYNVLFDVQWFDLETIFEYQNAQDPVEVSTYIHSNLWIETIGEASKTVEFNSTKVLKNLWKKQELYPTQKQLQRMASGYSHRKPIIFFFDDEKIKFTV